jgi:hypothetical protein
MIKGGNDMGNTTNKRPSSSDSNDTDLVEVFDDDDDDTRGTDQSDNGHDTLLNNDDGDDDETDGSEENLLSTDVSLKTLPAPKPHRNFTLVLSKSRTAAPPPQTSPTKNTSGATKTASPIRIKLSMKKLTASNHKSSDESTAPRSAQSDPQSSARNTSLDRSSSNRKVENISNEKNQVVQAIEGQTTTSSTHMHALAHGNVSSNNGSTTSDMTLTTNKVTFLEPKSLPFVSKTATGTASKRRSFLPTKQVRMPPLTTTSTAQWNLES